MMKRISALFLALFLLLSLAPPSVRAAQTDRDDADLVRNSDTEAALDGTCWLVDARNGGCLMVSRIGGGAVTCTGAHDLDVELQPLTDWPADQVLWWDGRLLVSAGEELRTLDPETGEILEVRRFEAPVERFAMSPRGLYVLTGGAVRFLGEKEEILVVGVTRFWLEDPDSLCWMRDEDVIHTLRLSDGTVTDAPNRRSDLGDVAAASGLRGPGLLTMKQKFPNGKYWNHMPTRGCGMTYNNQDGWTDQGCYKHNGYCGTSMQTCNGYAPDSRELSYQCWGYADKLGHDVSGQDPQKHDTEGCGWRKLWYSASLNNLKAGDIIRYNKNGNSNYAHSIYVTAVSGDTITYSDCNYDGSCVIRWDQTISRSTVKNWFVFLLSAPEEATTEPTYTLDVNASLDGLPAESCEGWAVFDVWINGKARCTGVSEYCETLPAGTEYELRNLQPVSGVCLEETEAVLSGALNDSRELLLTLDHYYLNSAGEKVKTTLTDLPPQDKWSYRPICRALEEGVALGLSATRFGPSEPCTRGQIVTFLWAAAGSPMPESLDLPFTDVKPGSYCHLAVCWALEQGMVLGRTPERFAPSEPCTRGEAVTFLWAAAGQPLPDVPAASPFRDVSQNSYCYPAALWAVQRGISSGTGEDTFSPKRTCTRAEILTFLYNWLR